MMRSCCTTIVAFLVTSLVLVSQSFAETMEHHTTRVRRALSSTLSSESADASFVPVTGLLFPVKTSANSADYMSYSAEKELIDALETDDQVTVVGEIQIGVLDCDSLEKAEDTTRLQLAIRPDEVITAERTSYTYLSGDIFEDGVARKVWIGEEVVNYAKDPLRTVSITWGEVCNVETFLLKVTSPEEKEGALSVVKTVPCITGAITELCVVEMEVAPKEEDEPDPTKAPVEVSRVQELGKARNLRPTGAKSVTSVRDASGKKRQLQSTTTIEVMYLYTKGVKEVLGDISDIQVQTTIAAAIATTNQAMNNSKIDLEISPVHVGSLPYNETSTSSSIVLNTLEANEDVADMRDTYEADLVQLVANLGFTCGRANLYTGNDTEAFSTVNPICFDYLSHTHEMAHNLGCYHNRDNSNAQTDYAHGYRYCNGTDPYRSIMSYPCTEDYTISRVNWFSNPDVELFDKPTGTADNDCARAIEEHMETVSEFRPVVEVVEGKKSYTVVKWRPKHYHNNCYVNPCLDSTNSDYRCTGSSNGKTIDLKGCSLTDTDTDLLRSCFEVVDITAITKIKLNLNSFTSLPYDLFDGIDSLATLNLLGSCDLTCVPPVPSETTVHLSSCNSDIGTCEA